MSFGLTVWDAEGNITFDEQGKYARIVDNFNPFLTGVAGSRSYPQYKHILASVIQGGRRPLEIKVSGTTVHWSEGNNNRDWPELSSPNPIIIVVQGV